MRMKLAWLANTRPDLIFQLSQIVQVTRSLSEKYVSKHLKQLYKATNYAHDNKASIIILKVDYDSPHIVLLSDAAFENNADLSSQLEHLVLLTNMINKTVTVSHK